MKKIKKIIICLLTVFALFAINTNVQAKESFYQADDNLSVEGNYDGTVFFGGDKVFANSQIKGIAFVAGNNVEVSGETEYGFMAGNSLKITGKVNNDLFAVGSNITINDKANIERDAYLGASTIDISDTTIGRDVKISAATVTLSDVTIKGDVYIAATTINLEDNVVIEGKLSYNETAVINGIENNKIGEVNAYEVENTEAATLASKIKGKLFGIVSGFIILLIMYLVFPNLFKKIDNKIEDNKASNYFSKIGIGFIGLIMIPIVSIISICTVIGMPIGFVLLASYAMSLYFGTLVTAYVVGNKLYTLGLKKEYNFYTVSFFGLIVMSILGLIPIVSGFVGFFGLLFGLGMIICLFIRDKK